MILGKELIRDRLRVKSTWLMPARVPFFINTDEHMTGTIAAPVLTERFTRYIVCLLFQGNAIVHQSARIDRYNENGTFEVKWSDVQIAPAAMPQIPEGAYDIENPIISMEGGTNLYGHVNGNSINLTVTYWDNDV